MAYPVEDKDALEFRQGLLATSYSERRDVVIEWRSANGNYAQMPQLVTELIQSKPELIVVESTAPAQAVKRATSTIPIVMAVVADPVGSASPEPSALPKRALNRGKADISDNWRAVPPGSTLSRHSTRQRRRWPDCASSRQTGLRTNRLELCGGS